MVNQDIINYLQEGKRRGFAISLLKEKLRGGGFSEGEINEAIRLIENRGSTLSKSGSVAQPQLINRPAVPQAVGSSSSPQNVNGSIVPKQPAPVQGPVVLPQSNVGPSYKVDGAANPVVKSGKKWIKLAGILGFIFFALSLLSLVSIFVPAISSALGNKYVSISIGVVGLILFSFYYSGFIKLGKRTSNVLIKFGAWMKLISIYAIVLLMIIPAVVLLNLAITGLAGLDIPGQGTGGLTSTDLMGSLGGVNLSSLYSEAGWSGIGIAVLLIVIILCIVFIVGHIVLAVGLINVNDRVKFAKLAGIFDILLIFLFTATIIFAVAIYYKLLIWFLIFILTGTAQAPVEVYVLIGLAVGSYLSLLLSEIFESLALLNASKVYE